MIQRWDIITIGNLSRNRYWGESEERALRPAICTSTLIRFGDCCLLVDPSLAEPDQMACELDRRTGLELKEITDIFITHHHGDHHFGLKHFPDAVWLAAPQVADKVNLSGDYSKPVQPATGQIYDAVEVISTPGHTMEHHSLRFWWDGLSVIVAGDAVMTADFWAARQGYHNSVDFQLASDTMDGLSAMADIIVPGHDNYFLV